MVTGPCGQVVPAAWQSGCGGGMVHGGGLMGGCGKFAAACGLTGGGLALGPLGFLLILFIIALAMFSYNLAALAKKTD